MRRIVILLCFFALGYAHPAFAANEFHPEKDAVVHSEKFWAEVVFKDDNAGVTQFRVLYHAPIEMVFTHLININDLQKHHASYADSRNLTFANYNKIIKEKPTDYAQLVQQIGDAKTVNFINRKPGERWQDYWYLRFNLPWPLSDKWVVQKAAVQENKQHFRVDYVMEHGNLKTLKGWWEVVEAKVETDPGWVEFRGETESAADAPMPKFLLRSIFISSLKKEFETNTKFFQQLVQ